MHYIYSAQYTIMVYSIWGDDMAYSEAQNKATQKYLRENMEQVRFWMPKGGKDKIKEFAATQNMSMAEYIKKLIEDDMKKAGYSLE